MTVTNRFIEILLGLILISACLEPKYDDIWSLDSIASINTIGYCRDLHIVDDIAYVAAGAAGVQGWDISELNSISNTFNINRSAGIFFNYDNDISQVYFSKINEDLFILENNKLLTIIHIANYDSLEYRGNTLSIGTAEFRISNEKLDTLRIYAADNDNGLKWQTLSRESYGWVHFNDTEVSTVGEPTGIDISDAVIIVSQGQHGIEIFSYDESSNNPISIGNFDTKGLAGHPTLSGNDLYVALDFGGAVYFDITKLPTDTTDTILTGYGQYFAEDLNVDHVSIYEDIAILSLGSSGIALFDVSNPNKPISKGIYDIGYTYKTVIHDGKVYVACREGLQIYEIHK